MQRLSFRTDFQTSTSSQKTVRYLKRPLGGVRVKSNPPFSAAYWVCSVPNCTKLETLLLTPWRAPCCGCPRLRFFAHRAVAEATEKCWPGHFSVDPFNQAQRFDCCHCFHLERWHFSYHDSILSVTYLSIHPSPSTPPPCPSFPWPACGCSSWDLLLGNHIFHLLLLCL